MKEYTVRTLASEIPMLTKAVGYFLTDIKRKGLSDETLRGYQVNLKQFNKFLSFSKITSKPFVQMEIHYSSLPLKELVV